MAEGKQSGAYEDRIKIDSTVDKELYPLYEAKIPYLEWLKMTGLEGQGSQYHYENWDKEQRDIDRRALEKNKRETE